MPIFAENAFDTVDETAQMSDMQGPSSGLNQMAGKSSLVGTPTRALVALWFAVLVAYWFMGWFFRGQRK